MDVDDEDELQELEALDEKLENFEDDDTDEQLLLDNDDIDSKDDDDDNDDLEKKNKCLFLSNSCPSFIPTL